MTPPVQPPAGAVEADTYSWACACGAGESGLPVAEADQGAAEHEAMPEHEAMIDVTKDER